MLMRYALVAGRSEQIAAYLPDNYQVLGSVDGQTVIGGRDAAGWTLDAYVSPAGLRALLRDRDRPVSPGVQEAGLVADSAGAQPAARAARRRGVAHDAPRARSTPRRPPGPRGRGEPRSASVSWASTSARPLGTRRRPTAPRPGRTPGSRSNSASRIARASSSADRARELGDDRADLRRRAPSLAIARCRRVIALPSEVMRTHVRTRAAGEGEHETSRLAWGAGNPSNPGPPARRSSDWRPARQSLAYSGVITNRLTDRAEGGPGSGHARHPNPRSPTCPQAHPPQLSYLRSLASGPARRSPTRRPASRRARRSTGSSRPGRAAPSSRSSATIADPIAAGR